MGLHDPTLDGLIYSISIIYIISAQKGFTYKYFGAARNLPGVKELLEKSSGIYFKCNFLL